MAIGYRSWFVGARSCTAACRATARSLVSNFSDTTKCHLNLLLLRLQTFCWWYFSVGGLHACPHGMGTSWLCGIVNSQDGTQGTSLPNFTYQSLVPLLPICKNTLKNKLSNSCIMDLLPHSQNKQSQKRAHTLSHLVCNWCPLFGTVDFSQTFQHSLVLCVNSWGTAEEAALTGEKAWKVSNWPKRVVDFPIIVLT